MLIWRGQRVTNQITITHLKSPCSTFTISLSLSLSRDIPKINIHSTFLSCLHTSKSTLQLLQLSSTSVPHPWLSSLRPHYTASTVLTYILTSTSSPTPLYSKTHLQKMNGYPKMKFLRCRSTKSRSMDFADLLSFPQTPKNTQNPTSKTPYANKPTTAHDSVSDPDDEDGIKGGSFGGVLRRNSSVTSAASLQSAVKRAFSMRRSSSVSERYCRIHDQSATAFLQSPPNNIDDEEAMDGGTMKTRSMEKKMKKKQKNGKIFKACKRLFGLWGPLFFFSFLFFFNVFLFLTWSEWNESTFALFLQIKKRKKSAALYCFLFNFTHFYYWVFWSSVSRNIIYDLPLKNSIKLN